MKALSFTPPWPNAIIHLGKRVENRTAWSSCSYRGSILLHAAKGVGSRADFDETIESIIDIVHPEGPGLVTDGVSQRVQLGKTMAETRVGGRGFYPTDVWWAPGPQTLRAGIVGRAEIVGTIAPGGFDAWVRSRIPAPVFAREPDPGEIAAREEQRKWWFGGFALVLNKVEPLPFVPWAGALGLFEVPDDYATRAAQVEVSNG